MEKLNVEKEIKKARIQFFLMETIQGFILALVFIFGFSFVSSLFL